MRQDRKRKLKIAGIMAAVIFVVAVVAFVMHSMDRTYQYHRNPYAPSYEKMETVVWVSENPKAYFTMVRPYGSWGQIEIDGKMMNIEFDCGYPLDDGAGMFYWDNLFGYGDGQYYTVGAVDQDSYFFQGTAVYIEDGINIQAKMGPYLETKGAVKKMFFQQYNKGTVDLAAMGFTTIFDWDPKTEVLTVTDADGNTSTYTQKS